MTREGAQTYVWEVSTLILSQPQGLGLHSKLVLRHDARRGPNVCLGSKHQHFAPTAGLGLHPKLVLRHDARRGPNVCLGSEYPHSAPTAGLGLHPKMALRHDARRGPARDEVRGEVSARAADGLRSQSKIAAAGEPAPIGLSEGAST